MFLKTKVLFLYITLILTISLQADNNATTVKPNISIFDVRENEGQQGITDFEFKVTLDKASTKTVTVDYETLDGIVVYADDFERVGKTQLTFNPGQTQKTITIKVNGDVILENDENFFVELSNPTNANIPNGSTRAEGMIVNDDDLYTGMDIDAQLCECEHNISKMTFYTPLSQIGVKKNVPVPAGATIEIDYKTEDVTAKDGEDYIGHSGTLVLTAGQDLAQFDFTILNDNIHEEEEKFKLILTAIRGTGVAQGRVHLEKNGMDSDKGNNERYGIIHDDDLDTNANNSYSIYDIANPSKQINTKIVNNPYTFEISTGSSFKGLYTIKYIYNCSTCGGCRLAQTITGGKFNRTEEERRNQEKVSEIQVQNKEIKLSSGGSVPCRSYTRVTFGGHSKNMSVDVANLYTFSDPGCSIPTTPMSVYDLLYNTPDHRLDVDSDNTIRLPFTPTYAFRCGYILLAGHSDKDYNQEYVPFTGASTDTFSTRPDHFSMSLPQKDVGKGMENLVSAGNNFSLKFFAKNLDDTNTISYNETITSNKTFQIDIQDRIYGDVNLTNYGLNLGGNTFLNGFIDINTSYDEVGELTIKVAETKETLYAKVDASDTGISPATYTIPTYTTTLRIIPDHFTVQNPTHRNFPRTDFTFYANNLNLSSSRFDTTITAVNGKGVTTKRYTSAAYAKDGKMELTFDATTQHKKSNLTHTWKYNTQNGNMALTNPITNWLQTVDINHTNFVNGTLQNNSFYSNFMRARNRPLEPLKLNISKVKIIDSDTVNNTQTININDAQFNYVSAFAPFQSTKGDTLDAKIYYETYCKLCDKSFYNIGTKESIDRVYWYILSNYNYCNFTGEAATNIVGLAITNSTPNSISLKAKQLPHKNRILYKPLDYLIYNKFNPNASLHRFNVEFTTSTNKWSGKGNLGSTVDEDVSQRSNESIDW